MKNSRAFQTAIICLALAASLFLTAWPHQARAGTQQQAELDRLWKLENQAADLMDAKKWPEADQLYRRVLKGYLPILGKRHKAIGRVWFNLGLLQIKQQKYDLAEKCFQACLANRKISLGSNHFLTGTVYQELAWLDRRKKRFGRAAANYQWALNIFDTENSTKDQTGATYLEKMVLNFKTEKMLLHALDLRQAIDLSHQLSKKPVNPKGRDRIRFIKKEFRETFLSEQQTKDRYAAHIKTGGPGRARLVNYLSSALEGLGYCLARANRRPAAIAHLEKALLLREVLVGPKVLWSIMVRSELRRVNEEIGRPDDARLLMVRASLRQKWQKAGAVSTAGPDVLDKLSNEIAYNAILQEIKKELAANGKDSKHLIGPYALIAPICAKMGKLKDAAEYAVRSVEIQQKYKRPARPGRSSGARSGSQDH